VKVIWEDVDGSVKPSFKKGAHRKVIGQSQRRIASLDTNSRRKRPSYSFNVPPRKKGMVEQICRWSKSCAVNKIACSAGDRGLDLWRRWICD
jgi:hypothetical protein